MVKLLGSGCDNEVVSELAAFCVHPDYRGSGRGDSLLAYLGQSPCCFSVCIMMLKTMLGIMLDYVGDDLGHLLGCRNVCIIMPMRSLKCGCL